MLGKAGLPAGTDWDGYYDADNTDNGMAYWADINLTPVGCVDAATKLVAGVAALVTIASIY